MSTPGVSGMAVYVPRLRVDLQRWCAWRGAQWAKVNAVVGASFRVCDVGENAYTMAAAAVIRLIDAYAIEPDRVGMLILATESSTDNAVGAAIVRGLVDAALVARGETPLASDCEVPEIKQACLAGIYGLKQAMRWLQTDGHGRVAIVVASDIAEYELYSTGEQTQGAGAVAMLVDERADLLAPDLGASGSASWFRGVDFRKPVARHLLDASDLPADLRPRDFPVFNGRYSTHCYVDAVSRAFLAMARRQGLSPSTVLAGADRLFFHRPYRNMPVQGATWLLAIAGLVDSDGDVARALALVDRSRTESDTQTSGVASPHARLDEALRAWVSSLPASVRDGALGELLANARPGADRAPGAGVIADLADASLPGDTSAVEWDADPKPQTSALVRAAKEQPALHAWISHAMALGDEAMAHCGNLYTASLPAWLAAGLTAAAQRAENVAGQTWLTIGYGSGDAAEAIPMRVGARWREATASIRWAQAFADPLDLDQATYEARHAGADGRPHDTRRLFSMLTLGRTQGGARVDVGIERYGCLTGERGR